MTGGHLRFFAAFGLLSVAPLGVRADFPVPEPLFPPILELAGLTGPNGFVINGIGRSTEFKDYSGWYLSGAGDVNADGINDVLVGGNWTYVVFGGPEVGLSGSFELGALDGSNGFAMDPHLSFATVARAGDVNADGIDDIIVGASYFPAHGVDRAGATFVLFGGPSVGASGSVDLLTLDGSNGFVVNGIGSWDFSGASVSGAGDLNADGVDDIIIGAASADRNGLENVGECYVIFGGAQVGSGGSIDASSLDGVNGFVIHGIAEFDDAGSCVSGAGDVNGDGLADVVIAARFADRNGHQSVGEVYIVFGAPAIGASGSFELSSLDGSNGFVVPGFPGWSGFGSRFGYCVSSAGDVNGDGLDDFMIGSPWADPINEAGDGVYHTAGETYVIFGAPGLGASGILDVRTLDGSNGFTFRGRVGESGDAIAGAGDVNHDGVGDIVIGAHFADHNNPSAGASYVILGATDIGSTGEIRPSSLKGANGFVAYGIDSRDYSAGAVAGVGDFNADSIDDLFIGAAHADPNGVTDAGECYLVFGRRRPTPNPADIEGERHIRLAGVPDAGEARGCVGDLDSDGDTDVFDFAALANAFGSAGADSITHADLDANGAIDVFDFAALIASFGCSSR